MTCLHKAFILPPCVALPMIAAEIYSLSLSILHISSLFVSSPFTPQEFHINFGFLGVYPLLIYSNLKNPLLYSTLPIEF